MALAENRFADIDKSVGYNAKELIDKPPLAMLKQVVAPEKIEAFLAVQIAKLVEQCNINANLSIQQYQIPVIAAQLVELYPVESLEDFVLCFKRGGAGFYGTIYKLDASVLCEWMKAYLDEKYTFVEGKVKEEQSKHTEANSVNYEEFRKRAGALFEKEKNNKVDNDYQIYKLNNPRDPNAGAAILEESRKKIERARRSYFLDQNPGASEEEIKNYLDKFKTI